jgi:hypothetical protein
MRTLISSIVIVFTCLSSVAQHKWDPFGDLPDLGWYAEGGVYSMRIAQELAWLGAAKGAVTWNDHHALGVAFKWSMNKLEPSNEVDPDVFLNVAFTSAFYEYTIKPKRVVHPVFSLDVGAGDMNMEFKEPAISAPLFPYGEQYFFFAQPQAKLEVNVHPRLKAHLAASYVWVSSLQYRALNAQNTSSPSFSIGLKYGRFL